MSRLASRYASRFVDRYAGRIFAEGEPLIPGLDADAQAIILAMAIRPNGTRQGHINTLVTSLKSTACWTPLTLLHVTAAHTQQAGLLNWKAPAGAPALATNLPTFTADRGFVGDGVSAFIDTQQSWSTLAGTGQDNAHIGAYARVTTAGGTVAGLAGSAAVSLQRVTSLHSTRLNNTAADTADAYSSSAGAHLCASRGAAGSYARYINGVAGTASAQVSAAPAAANLVGLRVNATYGGPAVALCALHAGPNLSATDVANIYAALQVYMVAVGAS